MLFQRLILLLLASAFVIPAASALTLEDYLGEVRTKNRGVIGLKSSSDAKKERKNEASLFFTPSFFFNAEYYDDQRPTNAPSFQGNQTLRHTLRTGFNQNLRSGTKMALSYNYYKTQINGAGSGILANPKFIDVAPMLEITQSLWRNWLGSEYKATEEAQIAQVESQRFNDLFSYKQSLMNAENAYWRLYVAQTSLKVQEESLVRAKKIRDWNANRVRSNLTDDSDLIQAEANLQTREIEYQDTLTEAATALRDFNSIREVDGDAVNLEGSKGKDSSYILEAALPMKKGMREDVRAYLANQKLALANAELGTQRNRPNLELYGTYSINGRDRDYNDAYTQMRSATRPFSTFGVRFTTPLDAGALSDYKKAYAKEVTASELMYKRKAFEVDREYEILQERFGNFKNRLKLAQKMEEVQGRKLVSEKRRYSQGRTTTFQVLQFEQDFANAQLAKLRFERELILVYNQLKLFAGVEYE
jgi:outer membrane protein TolC